MANATKPIDTKYREDFDYQLTCAAGQTLHKGTLVGVDPATGLAGNVSSTYGKIVGVMYADIDHPAGANGTARLTVGGERVQVRRGCHRFAQDGSISNANIGQVAGAIDDQKLTLGGGVAPAGVIECVDTDGYVWVDLSMARAPERGNGIVA